MRRPIYICAYLCKCFMFSICLQVVFIRMFDAISSMTNVACDISKDNYLSRFRGHHSLRQKESYFFISCLNLSYLGLNICVT